MKIEESLKFLSDLQPLADDSELDQKVIEKYDDVRRFFLQNPDPRCIPLFLNSFGKGDGLGVYQLIEDVLLKYSSIQVIPHLQKSLQHPLPNMRYWSVQIAASFISERLLEELIILLDDEFDIQYHAVLALSLIHSPKVEKVFRDK